MNPKIVLIIPCYNEADRLNFFLFNSYRNEIEFVFADDGSSDETAEIIRQHGFEVFRSDRNLGKGNIIYHAYIHLLKTRDLTNFQWIGYWDADLTIPLSTVKMMEKYTEFYPDVRIDSIWSTRFNRLGSRSRDKLHRHFFGRCFSIFIHYFLGIQAYDSQCGAKIFSYQASRVAFETPFISRWIFDIEILLRLRGKFIIEFPLITWLDMSGSKLKLTKEAFSVLKDLIKIRFKYRKLL